LPPNTKKKVLIRSLQLNIRNLIILNYKWWCYYDNIVDVAFSIHNTTRIKSWGDVFLYGNIWLMHSSQSPKDDTCLMQNHSQTWTHKLVNYITSVLPTNSFPSLSLSPHRIGNIVREKSNGHIHNLLRMNGHDRQDDKRLWFLVHKPSTVQRRFNPK
jgi:hypothetical protein